MRYINGDFKEEKKRNLSSSVRYECVYTICVSVINTLFEVRWIIELSCERWHTGARVLTTSFKCMMTNMEGVTLARWVATCSSTSLDCSVLWDDSCLYWEPFVFNHTASVTPQGTGYVLVYMGTIESHYQYRSLYMDQTSDEDTVKKIWDSLCDFPAAGWPSKPIWTLFANSRRVKCGEMCVW